MRLFESDLKSDMALGILRSGDRILIGRSLRIVEHVTGNTIGTRPPGWGEVLAYKWSCLANPVVRYTRDAVLLAVPTCTLWEFSDWSDCWYFRPHPKWTVSATARWAAEQRHGR